MEFRIVIADTDTSRRRAAAASMPCNANVRQCSDSADLLQTIMDTLPAVVVIGTLEHGPTEVVEAAHMIRDVHPTAKVIVLADFSSEAMAIGALRAGVFEYLKAPVDPLEIAEAVSRAVPRVDAVSDGFEDLIGVSEAIREIKSLIQRIAPFNSTVLINGESGTGKEIVARLIHRHSSRAQAPFVSVNCAAVPDSLVESELFGHERGAFTGAVTRQRGQLKNAHGGTLFLDEIGDMSLVAQSKMLRVLEQREIQPLGSAQPVPIDVRLITATHRDLQSLSTQGKFREDLYYRLDVSRIRLPPLRERVQDIPVLAIHFVQMMNRAHGRQLLGLTPAALHTLTRHDWPGNIRQLRNVIEAATALATSDWISEPDLRALHTFSVSAPTPLRTTIARGIPTRQVKIGKDALLEALEATHWNLTRTAEMLNWSRSTVYRKVARYKIQRNAPDDVEGASDEQSNSRRRAASTFTGPRSY
jgi:two-component system, NtrC family, response regulator HydG